jgi:hypothetical protein
MLYNDPLAGPGPPSPAETGTPVSAIVGSSDGRVGVGETIKSCVGELGLAATLGIGAGDRFKVEGSIGGEWMDDLDFSPGGGVIRSPGLEGESVAMLESSRAWVSPKLRVSDLLRSEPALCWGRLMCPVL